MWKVKDTKAENMRYRPYSPTTMKKAIELVRETGKPVRAAARQFGLPESSLRHRLSGRVDPEATRSGPATLFSKEEEARFVEHVKVKSACGYGYTRAELLEMASEFATRLGKRDSDHPLSLKWYTSLIRRWPELKVQKPRGLKLQRAKSTTVDCLKIYYKELESILKKYNLFEKPERIYSVDEKELSTSHTPSDIVTDVTEKPLAIKSNAGKTVTVIGCGNALGWRIPPFFIFPGARMRQELLDGGCTGANGDVSESGCVNSGLFRKYIEEHLMRYLPERSSDNPVMVFYDGHRSHVNLDLIDWAQKRHIILFILPAHTSHVLQQVDMGCFGPFEQIFNNAKDKFVHDNIGSIRNNICALGSAAYVKALSPENLALSFSKAGIYPFNPNAVDPSHFKPSEALRQASEEDVTEDQPQEPCSSQSSS